MTDDETPYFPLTLGIELELEVRNKHAEDTRKNDIGSQYPPTWHEGIDVTHREKKLEQLSEGKVFQDILNTTDTSKSWYIIGEPGAGKSRLLSEWFLRAVEHDRQFLGGQLPLLIPLRNLHQEHIKELLKTGQPRSNLDRLWAIAYEVAVSLGHPISETIDCRVQPIWLLDGLDELPDDCWKANVNLLGQVLQQLPGKKVLSCRTAIYQYRELRKQSQDQCFEIMFLSKAEQTAFLTLVMDDSTAAENITQQLQSRSPLSYITGRPLILREVAALASDPNTDSTALLKQTNNRAQLYKLVTDRRWIDKVKPVFPKQLQLVQLKKQVEELLAKLAERMYSNGYEGTITLTIEEYIDLLNNYGGIDSEVDKAIQLSGILRLNTHAESVEFLHLTFQEYHLAKYWINSNKKLSELLDTYWEQPRYEEALALYIAIQWETDTRSDCRDTILMFRERWLKTHRHKPTVLWGKGRSPLRSLFVLLGRSAIDLSDEVDLVSIFVGKIKNQQDTESGYKTAITALALAPVEVINNLANDPDDGVRSGVARNPATPAEALNGLANDPDDDVRWRVAGNPATPVEALKGLANDPKVSVRNNVIWNPTTPDDGVRMRVTGHLATPAEALRGLANDPKDDIRRGVAGHPVTPAETLKGLANDPDDDVRRRIADNPATPAEVLKVLANDPDYNVRLYVAWNPATPAEVLKGLANDPDYNVRNGVVWNPSTLLEDLLT